MTHRQRRYRRTMAALAAHQNGWDAFEAAEQAAMNADDAELDRMADDGCPLHR